jgi:hypothetical protein
MANVSIMNIDAINAKKAEKNRIIVPKIIPDSYNEKGKLFIKFYYYVNIPVATTKFIKFERKNIVGLMLCFFLDI